MYIFFFFFNDTATTEIYTLSLHDALPIFVRLLTREALLSFRRAPLLSALSITTIGFSLFTVGLFGLVAINLREALRGIERSEEHTSELQSRQYLVCRLLLEKKKNMQLTIS